MSVMDTMKELNAWAQDLYGEDISRLALFEWFGAVGPVSTGGNIDERFVDFLRLM
jgi:hypothetical protein